MLNFQTYPIAKQHLKFLEEESSKLTEQLECLLKHEKFFINIDIFVKNILNQKYEIYLRMVCYKKALHDYEKYNIV